MQLEVLNSKKIFSELLRLGDHDSCKKLATSVSKAGLLLSTRYNEHEKFIGYQDLVEYALTSKRCINFWMNIVTRKIDFDLYSKTFEHALLKRRI